MSPNLLAVATKAPWPPIDGGRVLLLNTVKALAAAGCRPTLVAPVDPKTFDLHEVARELSPWCTPRLVPATPRHPLLALIRAGGAPVSVVRHTLPAVRREVERLLAEVSFDVVHAEQVQALPQAEPAFARGVPVVLRAQNVESNLWAKAAFGASGLRGSFLWREAYRLARWEGKAVARTSATLALTENDAGWLRVLSEEEDRVKVVPAPFPELPAGTGRLTGDPAVVVFGSRGWLPNEESTSWFVGEIWPAVRTVLPGAVLHVFGADLAPAAPDVIPHPSPGDSAEVYAPGSILAVPLRFASGVRIKILEAWARGVPVVGTSIALSGLAVEDGREALIANGPQVFAEAIRHLHREPALAASLVAAGKRALRERHEPEMIAGRMIEAYREVIARHGSTRSGGARALRPHPNPSPEGEGL